MVQRIITEEDARAIKARLWAGERQGDINKDYAVHESTINRIATGKTFYDVPWPDGTVGEMPRERAVQIHRERYAGIRVNAVKTQLAKLGGPSPRAIAKAIEAVAGEFQEQDEQHLETVMRDAGEPVLEPPVQPKPERITTTVRMASLEDTRFRLEGSDFLHEAEKDIKLMNAARVVVAQLPTSQATAATIARLARNIVASERRGE